MTRTDEKAIKMYIDLVHDIHKYREERKPLVLSLRAGDYDVIDKINHYSKMIYEAKIQCSLLERLYDVHPADAVIFFKEFCDNSYDANFDYFRCISSIGYDD